MSRVEASSDEFAISVVIPAYNAAATIQETLESVLNQTYPVQEVIVVNDGSQDDTAAIVQGFDTPVTLLNQANGGVSAARNHGIQHASTPWIAFLDSDDLWLPKKLEMQVACLRRYESIQWCATRYYQCIEGKTEVSRYPEPAELAFSVPAGKSVDALQLMASNVNIWVSTVLIRKTLLLNAGGFQETLSCVEDSDLWICVAKSARDIVFVNQPLAKYQVDTQGLSRSDTKKISNARFEFYNRLAHHIEVAEDVDRPLFEKIFDRYAGHYMFNLARTGNVKASRELLRWFRERGHRVPGWRYRWIQWVPRNLIDLLRIVRRKRRSTAM